MSPAIGNWATPEQLERLRNEGWVESKRREVPEEGRIVLEFLHRGKRKVTFRSIPPGTS